MGSEMEARHAEKRTLLRILIAQHRSSVPSDFKDLLVTARAEMEPEDVKLVMQEFEEWKKD